MAQSRESLIAGAKRTGQGGKLGATFRGNRFSDCAGRRGLHCANQNGRVGVAGKFAGETAMLQRIKPHQDAGRCQSMKPRGPNRQTWSVWVVVMFLIIRERIHFPMAATVWNSIFTKKSGNLVSNLLLMRFRINFEAHRYRLLQLELVFLFNRNDILGYGCKIHNNFFDYEF